jgi:lipid-A-disaccharide synthase
MTHQPPVFALIAGEASGDQLGAALIEKLRARFPGAHFAGIGGHRMQQAGMECWWDADELAVMGLFEVLSHLPRLLRLRRELRQRLLELRPAVTVGIDAPDFNLGLEAKLRGQGLRTVHYVSPTVWAWRQRRVRKVKRAADRVLCLFPFEPAFYQDHGVRAVFVGHPMADRIPADTDPAAAREKLSLDPEATTIALLPGSRLSEIQRLAGPMTEAAALLAKRRPSLQFVAAMADDKAADYFREIRDATGDVRIHLVQRDATTVMAAADVVLCASGTATLETMLVNRPMVMTYKISPASYRLASMLRLVRLKHFSLPNILAGEALVPELIQDQATAPALAAAAERWLDDKAGCDSLRRRFSELRAQLECDASGRAAAAVAELLEEK